jgi:enediyne biosynthesis protein E4
MNLPGWARTIPLLLLCLNFHCAAALAEAYAGGFRSISVQPAALAGKAGFTLMSPEKTGVGFTNLLQGDAFLTNAVAHNGSGVALGDIDGDGWVDIYLCSLQGPNRLYRNAGGWRFEEVDCGDAACDGQFSTGAALADVDGDADLDLLVNGIASGTRLFLNDGRGRFSEAANSGLSRTASPTSMALADIDGDGDLDIYCAHYIDVMHLADPTIRFAVMLREGRWVVTKVNDQHAASPRWKDRFEVLPGGRVRELPEVHALYRNEGEGRFVAIESVRGVFLDVQGEPITAYRDWGLAAMFRDLNGDGAPDLYVCNDNASPDRIWINSGQGTFRAIDPLALRHTSRSSMGIDIADINRDGNDDIFVLDMFAREHARRMTQLVRDHSDLAERENGLARPRYNRNMLFLGRPDGSYAETALMAGVAATDWSWCPIFLDVDLDGYEDLLVSNGFSFDVMDQDSHDTIRKERRMSREQLQRSRQMHPPWPTANAAFRNMGNGLFEPRAASWGFDHPGVSNGMALADLDNDGDLDVVINNFNSVAGLYRNDAAAARIGVRLKGLPPNTEGIGARLRLVGGALTQSQEMISGGRYMSSDQAMRVFAADLVSIKPISLEVRWRNGDQSIIPNPEPNRIYEVNQAHATPRPPDAPPAAPTPLFLDVSARLDHRHTDEPFDDWARQPLLPRRLSKLGPGVSWQDLDGDGWEELIVSGGRGGQLSVFSNQQGASFRLLKTAPANQADQGAVAGWPDGKGNLHLLAAQSNYTMPPGKESALAVYSLTNLLAPALRSAGMASLGPIAVADVDGDGDLDLFVGGHFQPGRYPEAVSSAIWVNENNELRMSPALSKPFKSIGLVSGATFADLDGDGWSDLALAIEWGPVRLFRNVKGQFEEMTSAWGFAETSGWWTSIVAADFDNDGRLDLAAGNWGSNTSYQLHRPGTLGLFYGEWSGRGRLDPVEAWQRDDGDWLPVRDHHAMAAGFADLTARFPTHQAYGNATVQELLGERMATARLLTAKHLESAVFLNRGSKFELRVLPLEAQLAPVFGISAGDFDGDGFEDLFLAQNFIGTASDLSRDDSGLGLWLGGNGDGTFRAIDPAVSGIRIEGEQRGAALADFNHDGRIDLAVGQNNGPTKLYMNNSAKRGLRVVLIGPSGNPQAIGAQLRVLTESGRQGACRAVQAGSGYWSQDSAAQVLGLPESAAALWIRWPGGKEQTVPLGEGVWELRLNYPQ